MKLRIALLLLSFQLHALKLEKRLDTFFSQFKHIPIGCEVYSFNQQKVIYAKESSHLLTPASNTKLFTCLCALEYLSESYCFSTELITDGYIEDATLKGNLYLKGSGDPSLTSEDVAHLVKQLHDLGIERVAGNFYFDSSCFDQEYFAPGTTVEDIGGGWMRPISGLMIDRKPITLFSKDIFCLNKDISSVFIDGVTLLGTLFNTYNIIFEGAYSFGTCPDTGTVVAVHYSQPLATLIKCILKRSDNLYADCLFKKIAAHQFGVPGSWANGSLALAEFVEGQSILFKDGSGLSRYNLVSAHDVISLLIEATQRPYFEAFYQALPVSGVDGTLKKRMPSIGWLVRAKTGTLSGVSALSGYIETEGDLLVFSVLINGFTKLTCNVKKEIEDALCKMLVE